MDACGPVETVGACGVTIVERREICLGFDGSQTDDLTVIRAETREGFQFTPTYGPDAVPTIWKPEGGQIPRLLVHAAIEELFDRYLVKRMYYDPPFWTTEGQVWEQKYGEKIVASWETYRPKPMWEACERFLVDLHTGALTHDDCPVTAEHMANTRKMTRSAERYVLSKPLGAYHQKIDAAVTSVICHEAACDARSTGWGEAAVDSTVFVFRR